MEANCVCDSIVVAMADLTCRPENMNERWQSCVDRCVGEEKEERHEGWSCEEPWKASVAVKLKKSEMIQTVSRIPARYFKLILNECSHTADQWKNKTVKAKVTTKYIKTA